MTDRNRLIEENLNLVWFTLRKYYPRMCDIEETEDLFQIGCLGLIYAADTYDDAKSIAFTTYAVGCIRTYISHEFSGRMTQKRSLMKKVSTEDLIYDGDKEISELLSDNRYCPENGWYDDLSAFRNTLTPGQKIVFDQMISERPMLELAKQEGCSHQALSLRVDIIRKKFSEFYDIPEYYSKKRRKPSTRRRMQ